MAAGWGNFYHKGNVREEELKKSCEILGIPGNNCFVVKNSSLQDDPTIIWDKKLCGKVILDYIHEIKPDTILTFDSYGVSGHKNHRSLYFALQYLISDGRLPEGVDVFCLDSISLPRQYFTLFVLDLPVSLMTSDLIVVSPWRDFLKGQHACLAHWSQMEWFRILHLTFSRYMVVNSYQRISTVSSPVT
ncbi:N-acetylglucosaminyl-phosphatidylinositol de-N-acetylase-like [Liolophura sinensis]|uniref:N-acetylglucosaminyl-phosphatidylinositol de-N-acetylase-like n=1 Tax=Liolophura sinensis TaxID=3198878 RepID=UPI0031587B9C